LIKKTIFIIFGFAFYCPKAIFPFFSWLPRFFGGAFFLSDLHEVSQFRET